MFTKYISAAAIVAASFVAQTATAATTAPTAQSDLLAGNDKLSGNAAHVAATIAAFDALVTGYFVSGWSFYDIGKFNTSGATNGSEIDDITVTGDGGAANATSGSWSYSGGDTPFIVVYKGGPNYIAQFFEGGISGNMYDLADLGLLNGSGTGTAGLSHLSLYGVDGQPIISAVPLPASSLLLVVGLGGLAAMRRRKG